MSSKNKTPNLKLNLWDGTDKPKRSDFNSDNEILDSVIGAHIGNTDVHITEETIKLLSAPFITGTYVGDGASSKIVNLGFMPSFVVAFASNSAFSVYDKDSNKVYSFGAAAGSTYASVGIQTNENGFTVTESTGVASSGSCYPRMNTSGYRYQYIAFK